MAKHAPSDLAEMMLKIAKSYEVAPPGSLG
jgi:hypothetical protein